MSANGCAGGRVFQLILIKPSKYDDDGYVIHWRNPRTPSNSLAALYGIAKDCAERRVLGSDVEIRIDVCDEIATRIDVTAIIRRLRGTGGHGMVGFVGVQSNQFPRAVDLARQFRSEGVQVCIGGFHVSGCLAMLPDIPADLQEAIDLGVSLFAGEAEGWFDVLLRDAYEARLKPVYNYLSDLPNLAGVPLPDLDRQHLQHFLFRSCTFDAGRGCPFQCSFCTIINVQGRKTRNRSADDIEQIVRNNLAKGISHFFITDDNFARNGAWEGIFDRLITLREREGIRITLNMQVDTACHRIPRFIEKSGRAGVTSVFIGLENINPDTLAQTQKGQNVITEYHAMLQAWHAAGVTTSAGYILGFPNDTRESMLRDIEIIKRELPIDILYFFVLTPLPGSADHKKLLEDGVDMDSDMNQYDTCHSVTDHPKMARQELQQVYWDAWHAFYTEEHLETILRRSLTWANSRRRRGLAFRFLYFSFSAKIEKIHPLEGGLIRRKYRRDRRPSLTKEDPIPFYLKHVFGSALKLVQYFYMRRKYSLVLRRVENGLSASAVQDIAHKAIQDDDFDRLALFTQTAGGKTLIERVRRKRRSAAIRA